MRNGKYHVLKRKKKTSCATPTRQAAGVRLALQRREVRVLVHGAAVLPRGVVHQDLGEAPDHERAVPRRVASAKTTATLWDYRGFLRSEHIIGLSREVASTKAKTVPMNGV